MILKDIINDLNVGDIIVCRCSCNTNTCEKHNRCKKIYAGQITKFYSADASIKLVRNDCSKSWSPRVGEITHVRYLYTSIEFVI